MFHQMFLFFNWVDSSQLILIIAVDEMCVFLMESFQQWWSPPEHCTCTSLFTETYSRQLKQQHMFFFILLMLQKSCTIWAVQKEPVVR